MPVWLWRPNRTVQREPSIDDYRGCCGGCKVDTCYKINLALDILGMIIRVVGLINQFRVFDLINLFFWIFTVTFGVIGISTKKPFFMQLYWICEIVNVMVSMVSLLLTIGVIAGVFGVVDKQNQEALSTALIVYIIVTVFTVPITYWTMTFLYGYYCYIRDYQIWIEQQDTPSMVDVKSTE